MTKLMYAGCVAVAVCAVALGIAIRNDRTPNDVERRAPERATQPVTAAVLRAEPTIDRSTSDPAPAANADVVRHREKLDEGEQVPVEVIVQRREAAQAIDLMVAGGVWGNEQRMSFFQKLSLLPPDQAAQAYRRLMVAFNEGHLQIATDGPPL